MIEKRETLDGETVKRENLAAGWGPGGRGVERGGGGDILALLRSGERLNRGPPPPPYQRRIGMIQEMMGMAKQGRHDQATEVLKSLRQVGFTPSDRQVGFTPSYR